MGACFKFFNAFTYNFPNENGENFNKVWYNKFGVLCLDE